MNSTDQEWERWGRQDPYFAVITDPKFRKDQLTETGREEFFASGQAHLAHVMAVIARHVRAGTPRGRALDFGCGVGRVTLAMARHFDAVTGVDVSSSMLEEAARNAAQQGVSNVEWSLSDDTLSRVSGHFDFVHTCITLQHVDVPRGRVLFRRLVELVAPGGAAAIQITYAKAAHAETLGQPPVPPPRPAGFVSTSSGKDPEMQMNAYHLGELAYLLQTEDVRDFHAEFTNHGGELGVFMFFGKPGPSVIPDQPRRESDLAVASGDEPSPSPTVPVPRGEPQVAAVPGRAAHQPPPMQPAAPEVAPAHTDLAQVQMAPERSPQELRERSASLEALGRMAEAVEAAKKASQCAPNDAEAVAFHSMVLCRAGRIRDGIERAEVAAAMDPRNPHLWAHLSVQYGRLQRWEDAVWAIDHTVALDPWSGHAHLHRSTMLEQLGRLEAAMASAVAASAQPDLSEDARARVAHLQAMIAHSAQSQTSTRSR